MSMQRSTAFVADENGGACDQLADFVLALATERAMQCIAGDRLNRHRRPQSGLPSTKAKGTTKSSSPRSSLTCKTQSRQSSRLRSPVKDSTYARRMIPRLREIVDYGAA